MTNQTDHHQAARNRLKAFPERDSPQGWDVTLAHVQAAPPRPWSARSTACTTFC